MQESRWSRAIKEYNLVHSHNLNNHNGIKLYITANKSTMYTSYYDKIYELL